MTDKEKKEIANRIQAVIDSYDGSMLAREVVVDLTNLKHTIDPPLPEPGTVVWWKASKYDQRRYGIVASHISGINAVMTDTGGELLFEEIGIQGVDWGVARQPGSDEMVVKVPHTTVWPVSFEAVTPAVRADLVWHFIDYEGRCFNQQVATHGSITRAEAMRMEADGWQSDSVPQVGGGAESVLSDTLQDRIDRAVECIKSPYNPYVDVFSLLAHIRDILTGEADR